MSNEWAPCESAIELMLLNALLPLDWRFAGRATLLRDPPKPGDFDGWFLAIIPQAQIADYRVDFLLLARWDDSNRVVAVVIECDGHDFHERTKEQAARDKSRDRALMTAGYAVLRFTGSEIYRAPRTCAEQVRDYFYENWIRTL